MPLKFKEMRLVSLSIFIFFSCNYYDKDITRQASDGDYYLTPLGCLVNGAWGLNNDSSDDGYNVALYIDKLQISSVGVLYSPIQKDLVFQLFKDGKIRYWFKSENNELIDTIKKAEIKLIVKQSPSEFNIKNFYSLGFWKANFNDSTVHIHFDTKNVSDLNFKWIRLGNGDAAFQQISFFDSVYNGKKVVIKKISTFYYTLLYHFY